MGRVYEATRSWDGLRVALKFLRPEVRSPAARRTLVNEALATAHLAHPNLVAILDVGEHPDLGVFLVQELVIGTSLDTALVSGAHVDEGIAALVAVLEGLTVAHAGGVVHGDLKPSNVLLTASGLVKLCDFGVAQSLGPRKDGSGRRIRAGTPQYMAPEQFETTVDLDPRTDLYAVGAMLYQVLTGLLPHRNTESIDGILEEKRRGVPRPRFDRAGRAIPPGIAELVVSLTEPDLCLRPRFAAEALETLRTAAAVLRALPSRVGPGSNDPAAPSALAAPSPSSRGRDPGTVLLPTRMIDGKSAPARPALNRPERAPIAQYVAPLATEQGLPAFLPASHLPGTAFIHVRPPALVGRTRQIAAIRSAIRDASKRREVHAVVFEGEEGVGKSRLAEWGLAECERTGAMEGVAARSAPEGGNPARGLRGLVARVLAPASTHAGEGTRRTIAWLRQRGLGTDVDVDGLVGWLQTSTEDDAVDAHTAASLAAAALRAYARVRPLYLWLDDALWATDGTFELAERLLAAGDAPIVVVVTCNDVAMSEPRGAARHAALVAHRGVARFALPRLDAAERAALLRGTAPLSRELADHASSLDTTPLVLVQLVGDWLDRGLLASSAGGLVASVPMAALFDARTPSDVFRHRALGLLGAVRDAAAVLHAVAILGPWCTSRALYLVGGALDIDEESIDLVLEEALVRGVLRSDGGDSYRLEHQVFRVELIRAAAVDASYKRICSAVAQSLLDVHGRERPDVRAYAAVWLRDAGKRAEATTMLLEASDQMARGGDVEAARRQVELVRRWIEADGELGDSPRCDLLVYVEARLAYFMLDYPRAIELARDASRRLALRGSEEALLRSKNLELRILFYDDRIAECEALMSDVRRDFAHLASEGSYAGVALLHLAADLRVLRGDLRGARDLLRAATSSPDYGDGWHRMMLLCDLAAAEAAVGGHAEAQRALAEVRGGRGQLDVYQLAALRERDHAVALASSEKKPRAFYAERVEDERARGDRWRLTHSRIVLALYDVRFEGPSWRESVENAIASFSATPHDEAISHAFLIAIAAHLHDRGEEETATRIDELVLTRRRVGNGEASRRGSIPAGAMPIGETKPSA
jgi:hypothetical protein